MTALLYQWSSSACDDMPFSRSRSTTTAVAHFFICRSLVSSLLNKQVPVPVPVPDTSIVHKLSALSYIAVAQSKSCGIFHI